MNEIEKLNAPTVDSVHVNGPLTNYAMKWMLDSMQWISMKAVPFIGVGKKSDEIPSFDKADWLRAETGDLAPGEVATEVGYDVDSDTYKCKVYAFRSAVDEQQRDNADAWINPDESATDLVSTKIMQEREVNFVNAIFTNAAWAAESRFDPDTTTGLSGEKWSNDNSDPIKDVRSLKRAIAAETGFEPNRMILSRDVKDTLLDHPEILDRFDGGATTDKPAKTSMIQLASLFEVDEILVVNGIRNTAKKGADESTDFIAKGGCLIYYAPRVIRGTQTPTSVAVFNWTGSGRTAEGGMRTMRYPITERHCVFVEVQMAYQYKKMYDQLARFGTAVI